MQSIVLLYCMVDVRVNTDLYCFMPKLVCPILILIIVSASICFPDGKVIGMVRLRTSFIISRQFREIDNHHLTHSYILKRNHLPQCEHCRHTLVECNHFAETKRKNIFCGRDVESFILHHTIILFYIKKMSVL